jgi:hypothetical protein
MFIIIMTVIIFAKIQIISEYTSIMKEKMQFAFLFLKIFLEKRLHMIPTGIAMTVHLLLAIVGC